MKHRGDAICPLCGQALTVEKRRSSLQRKASLTLIHRLDEKRGIQRHFDVTVDWEIFRVVKLHETIRCMLHKGAWSMQPCEYYYAQHRQRCLIQRASGRGLKGRHTMPGQTSSSISPPKG